MITVVFTSFNGAKTLPLMLNSLTKLTPPNNDWKLIAVNNSSTDETNDILNQFIDKLPLTILFEKNREETMHLTAQCLTLKGSM